VEDGVDKPRRTIEARRLFGFAEVTGDRHLIAATVGPHLDPVILSSEREPDYRTDGPGATFPRKRGRRPNRFRIHHRVADEVWTTLDLPETDENLHDIQPLGEHEWLLVRGRADGEGDRNANVHDASGRHARSFHAGDGIQDVQATPEGQVWISYFDEGVFGGTRLGQAGLARLNGSGGCWFEFNPLAGGGLPDIADCYALNVASDREVWLYYYTEFPLVRLVDGEVEGHWPNVPVKGSGGFAVRAPMVLFAGGYDRRDDLILARLGDKRGMGLIATDEGGRPLEGFSAFGRRDHLFLQTEEALYVVEVPDRLPNGRPGEPSSWPRL
jgi:hypothetical protein